MWFDKILRNPFTRLYSAWNDKSRTHRFQNGSIMSDEGFGLRIIFRTKGMSDICS